MLWDYTLNTQTKRTWAAPLSKLRLLKSFTKLNWTVTKKKEKEKEMVYGLITSCLTVFIQQQQETILINVQIMFEVALLAAM